MVPYRDARPLDKEFDYTKLTALDAVVVGFVEVHSVSICLTVLLQLL